MLGGRHALGGDLLQLIDVVEDATQFLGQALDLRLGQPQAGEGRGVQHVFACDGHGRVIAKAVVL